MDWLRRASETIGTAATELGQTVSETAAELATSVGEVAADVSQFSKDKASEAEARTSMEGCIKSARAVLVKFVDPELIKADKAIPFEVLKMAKGVAFVSQVKAGFVFSGIVGTGIVVTKTADGSWSGPSCIGTAGMGWGLQVGANYTDSVIILNNDEAVKAFTGKAQVKLGAELSVAAGPIGRSAGGDIRGSEEGVAACFSYSHSQGLFAGLALEGAVMSARDADNRKFYGDEGVTPASILSGAAKAPESADLAAVYALLDQIQNSNGGGGEGPGPGPAQEAEEAQAEGDDVEAMLASSLPEGAAPAGK